jgi:HK97 gp10 family phage protein
MSVEIRGIDDVRRVLRDVMPKEARILSRQTTKDVATAIADEAKVLMPIDEGDMVAGTRALQERDKDGVGMASVRVRGAFYWRFLEYGDGPDGIEHAFFMRAREKVMQNIDSIATRAFVQRLAARIAKVAGR